MDRKRRRMFSCRTILTCRLGLTDWTDTGELRDLNAKAWSGETGMTLVRTAPPIYPPKKLTPLRWQTYSRSASRLTLR